MMWRPEPRVSEEVRVGTSNTTATAPDPRDPASIIRPHSKRPEPYKLEPGDFELDVAVMEDVNCIVNDWAASEATQDRGNIDPEIFKVGIRERIARILQAHKAAVVRPTPKFYERLGVPPMDHGIMAWSVYGWDLSTQQPCVHFIYTKHKFRTNGLARLLLEKAAGVIPGTFAWTTHMRRWLRPVAERAGLQYNPFLLERRK